MNFFKKIFSKIEKEKIPTEEIPETLMKQPSGFINIDFDVETGDFHVYSEINDTSNESVEILGLLLYYMTNGGLDAFIHESLSLWSGDDPERIKYTLMVLEYVRQLDDMILQTKNLNQEDATKKVAVSASKVFNLRDIK